MRTRNLLTLIFIPCAALAACNRAAEIPSSDDLATRVAGTLTAVPPLPPVITLPPSPTPPPSATSVATAISVPTATPLPPTATFTSTVASSPTATPPSLPPDDPRAGLSLTSPDYRDDFSQSYTWGNLATDGAENGWVDGRFRAVDKLTDHYITWSTTGEQAEADDLYVEVTSTIETCSGRDAAGLAIRVGGDNLDNGYTLEVSCDGAFRIRKFVAGSVKTLVGWTATDALSKGPNAVNRMGVLARGSKLYAYANGKLLGQAEDTEHTLGNFGLYASAETTEGLTVYFDDFWLWWIKP